MSSPLEITLLGTGTSQGVPVIGCTCPVCMSSDPRDKRWRSSCLISTPENNLLVDCGPDFRIQALKNGVTDVDAVFFTHEHNDHVAGLDDLRPIIFKREKRIKLYATERVFQSVKRRFYYAFEENPYPGAPVFEVNEIDPDSIIEAGDTKIHLVPAWHGDLPISGLRVGDFAYMTDVNNIPKESVEMLTDLDVLVLDALHHQPHHSHFNVAQAIEMAERINADQTYFTHCSHRIGLAEEVNAELPDGMSLAYDGQKFKWS